MDAAPKFSGVKFTQIKNRNQNSRKRAQRTQRKTKTDSTEGHPAAAGPQGPNSCYTLGYKNFTPNPESLRGNSFLGRRYAVLLGFANVKALRASDGLPPFTFHLSPFTLFHLRVSVVKFRIPMQDSQGSERVPSTRLAR